MLVPVPSGYREHQIGYIFFVSNTSLVAEGIGWFQRWQQTGKISVFHTGVVTGPDECVEAHWRTGVALNNLADYEASKETLILYRKPRGWTPELGNSIAASAKGRLGARYNKGLILSQLASNTFVGHALNWLFNGGPERWLSRVMDDKQEFICSELSAYALAQQPIFEGKGILAQPLDTISPQELFEDNVLFE